jgi:hypothetical protein
VQSVAIVSLELEINNPVVGQLSTVHLALKLFLRLVGDTRAAAVAVARACKVHSRGLVDVWRLDTPEGELRSANYQRSS